MRIETENYVAHHGRAPRGFGEWAFLFDRGPGEPAQLVMFSGTYSEAKRKMLAFARQQQIDYVEVAP